MVILSQKDEKLKFMLETNLFLPAWWVVSCDHLYTNASQNLRSPIKDAIVLPRLDFDHWAIFPTFLSKIQADFLETGSKIVELNSNFLAAIESTAKNTRIQNDWFGLLGGVRIQSQGGRFIPLIRSELTARHDTEDAGALQLEFTDLGVECCLGLIDPYKDTLRKLKGEAYLLGPDSYRAPIAVPRALWHELNLNELTCLLRMEKSMQWDLKWLHLNHTFGISFRELFAGVKINIRKGGDTEFKRQLRFLERFGKKLLDHGYSKYSHEGQYLYLNEGSGDLHSQESVLGWTMSPGALQWENFERYQNSCVAFLEADVNSYSGGIPKLVEQIASIKHGAQNLLLELTEFRKKISDNGAMLAFGGAVGLGVSGFALFSDIVIRAELGGNWQPHSEALDFFGHDQRSLGEKWRAFKANCNSDKGELTAQITDKSKWFLFGDENYADLQRKWLQIAKKEVLEVGSSVSLNGEARELGNAKVDSRTSKVPSEREDMPETPTSKKLTTTGLGSKLRRIAAEELKRLKRQQPKVYEQLAAKYLDSLGKEERKTWNEVVSRLNPSLREQQLKMRLIRFMVDNPNLWESSGSAVASKKP